MTFTLVPSTLPGHARVRSSTGLTTIDLPILAARRVLNSLRSAPPLWRASEETIRIAASTRLQVAR